MQLTMMGVLTLKAVGPTKSSTSNMSSINLWSEYAKMVIFMAPLLLMTYFLYDILRRAYETLIKNIPFEVLGKVQVASRNEQGLNTEQSEANISYAGLSRFATEIEDARGSRSERRDSMSSVSSIGDKTRISVRGGRSIFDPISNKPSPFQAGFESQVSVTDHDYHYLDPEDSLLRHAEPPMTRVKGILDPPIVSGSLNEFSNEITKDDCQLYSYLHPALIGKLPVAWLPSQTFVNLRVKQIEDQQNLMKRYTYRQRLELEQYPIHEQQRVGKFTNFVDGFTSFIHYILS
jgi:hypothetical protein